MSLTLYALGNVNEGSAAELTPNSFSVIPPAMPFAIQHVSWQLALSGSAVESSGSMVHRSLACQIQHYGPINQSQDRIVWSSNPILVPWGQKVTGRRRINAPWFDANTPRDTTRLIRLEVLCLEKDSATVEMDFVLAVRFKFRAPDYSAACPNLSMLVHRPRRDDDEDHESGSSLPLSVRSVFESLSLGND